MTDRYWAIITDGVVSGVFLGENEEIMRKVFPAEETKIIEVTHLVDDRPGPGWSIDENGQFLPPDGPAQLLSPNGVPLPEPAGGAEPPNDSPAP